MGDCDYRLKAHVPARPRPVGVELHNATDGVYRFAMCISWVQHDLPFEIRTSYDNLWPWTSEVIEKYDQLMALVPEHMHSEIDKVLVPFRMDIV